MDGKETGAVKPRLGIVVPLANEQATVTQLLERITAQIDADDQVFCVLDNASRDATRALVQSFAGRDARVILVWAPENRCAVDAYFAGYRAALAAGCAWILEMDGGFSHPPEEIPRFIDAMRRGSAFAAGSRFVAGGVHVGSWKRRMLSWGGTQMANVLLGTRMKDMTSGFECFSRDALERVVERGVRSRAHFFQTEIRTMLHDMKWVEVPITYTNPSPSVGRASVVDALRNLWRLRRDVVRARRDDRA